MERYEISAKKSKVYTWDEAKKLMKKGKVMCGEWIGNGPPQFYRMGAKESKGLFSDLYYTNDFEEDWILEAESIKNLKKFHWYRAKEVIDKPVELPKGVHKVIEAIEHAEFNTKISIVYKMPHTRVASKPLKCMQQNVALFTAHMTVYKKSISLDRVTIWFDDIISVVVGHEEYICNGAKRTPIDLLTEVIDKAKNKHGVKDSMKPKRKVQPYYVRTKVCKRLEACQPNDKVHIAYGPQGVLGCHEIDCVKEDIAVLGNAIEYIHQRFIRNTRMTIPEIKTIPLTWITELTITKANKPVMKMSAK